MVVQVDNDMPLEAPVVHKMESENIITNDECKKSKKTAKSRKRHRTESNAEQNIESPVINSVEISESDLEELRSVYKKCKAVIKKIETKYGHLLEKEDLPNTGTESSEFSKCSCTFNKKTVFDDNGQQITQEIIPDIHICPKRPKFSNSVSSSSMPRPNIQIEDESFMSSLPDDLRELCDILRDPNIDIVYRNKVIEKIKVMKMDNTNTMRFDRKLIIERLKTKPDELMEFKGSNVSSLPGYPSKPEEIVKSSP